MPLLRRLEPWQIKQLRKELHKTQAEFAALCRVRHWITVSRWENGQTHPQPIPMRRILDMYEANENAKAARHHTRPRGRKALDLVF